MKPKKINSVKLIISPDAGTIYATKGVFIMAKNSKEVQKRADAKRAQDTAENWEMIVYPDSAPDGWRDILRGLHVPLLISPLHDKDAQPDGTMKKPHWHVILIFGAKKSKAQIREITAQLNTVDPMRVYRLSGAVRYLIHKDDPDKAQYDAADVECYNGANFLELIACNTDIRTALKGILNMIRTEDIRDYDALLDKLLEEDNTEWFIVATEARTLAITKYIDSRWKRIKTAEEKEEKERLKMNLEKRREAEHEWDYLSAIGEVINGVIKGVLNGDEAPPPWNVIEEHIRGQLVDAGYAYDALDEYVSKRGINVKHKYEAETGWDSV